MHRPRSTFLLFALLIGGGNGQAAECFTPEEARAAHLRALQQQFTVAALNCQTVDPQPGDPDFPQRYNRFVIKYGEVLFENARVLRIHFKRAGGNFDSWMTKVANAAGQRVMTDTNFCQAAWQNLESSLAVAADQIDTLAASVAAADPYAPVCPAAARSAPTAMLPGR